jgi:hypothetical protein
MIAFSCPRCQARLRTRRGKPGDWTKCPQCGSPVQVTLDQLEVVEPAAPVRRKRRDREEYHDEDELPRQGGRRPSQRGATVTQGLLVAGLVLFGLLVLSAAVVFLEALTGWNKTEQEQMKQIPVSSLTWDEVNGALGTGSQNTNLQRQDAWKQYRGKKVRWQGTVTSIDEGPVLMVKMNRSTIFYDLEIRLSPDQRAKALKLSRGDTITFTGILDQWHTALGTDFTLTHGELIESN